MLRAGTGCSTATNARIAALEATQAALKQAGLRTADAALCFASTTYGGAYPLLVRTVAEAASTREVAGCESIGVIGAGREVETGPSVSVLVWAGDTVNSSRLFVPQLRGRAREAARTIAETVRPKLGTNNLLCLFPDTYNIEAEPFLSALREELPGVTIVGGGATEDGSIGETFQFCGDVVSSNAISGMLLAGEFELNVGSTIACAPLGRGHRVTAVRDNIIIELDGRRAWDVFAEAAGPLAGDLPRALAFVFVAIPLNPAMTQIERGEFYVRNVTGASAEHGVIAVAHRPRQGDLIGFVLRDAERSRQDLKLTLEAMQTRVRQAPAFGLYFDCVSRGSGLYQMPDHDSAYIAQAFGAMPVAGFFTGFEIGPLGSEIGALQYSGVLATIAEKA
jgi:small ligand-binding sensory domain FIST